MDNTNVKMFKTEKEMVKRIERRLAEGWSLERIAERTVWHMYGHLWGIKDGVLTVSVGEGGKGRVNFTLPAPQEVTA